MLEAVLFFCSYFLRRILGSTVFCSLNKLFEVHFLEQNLVGNGVERCCDCWTYPNADNPEFVPKDHHQSHGDAQGEVCEASDDCSGGLLARGSDY
jgi:hypothetical protein